MEYICCVLTERSLWLYNNTMEGSYQDMYTLKYIHHHCGFKILAQFQADAFSNTGIQELSIQGCGLTNLSQGAFAGLEKSLQLLDLGANNLTDFPHHLFHAFNFLHILTLRGNKLSPFSPEYSLQDFQASLNFLDISGSDMGITSLQGLYR